MGRFQTLLSFVVSFVTNRKNCSVGMIESSTVDRTASSVKFVRKTLSENWPADNSRGTFCMPVAKPQTHKLVCQWGFNSKAHDSPDRGEEKP